MPSSVMSDETKSLQCEGLEEIEMAAARSCNYSSWCQWKPTSQNHLVLAETKMLEYVNCSLEKKYVHLPSGNKLWTVIANKQISQRTPIVMVHGFAGGVGLWALNYDELSKKRPVYTFDLLGFGRSSRPKFNRAPEIAEDTFIDSIEQWRQELNLNKFILMGHSFGGYLASSYALKYPDRVEKLILVDPWGFPVRDSTQVRQIPMWIRVLIRLLSPFNPLAAIRAAGPFGPNLIKRFRADFRARFADICDEDDDTVFEYIYHCNAASPSGEAAFKRMTEFVAYAYKPMLSRIGNLRNDIPVTFIFGAKSWMDVACGYETQKLLPDNDVEVFRVEGAGHHVYADRPDMFHMIVDNVCEEVD